MPASRVAARTLFTPFARARVAMERALGERLSDEVLADALGVSRSWVERAMRGRGAAVRRGHLVALERLARLGPLRADVSSRALLAALVEDVPIPTATVAHLLGLPTRTLYAYRYLPTPAVNSRPKHALWPVVALLLGAAALFVGAQATRYTTEKQGNRIVRIDRWSDRTWLWDMEQGWVAVESSTQQEGDWLTRELSARQQADETPPTWLRLRPEDARIGYPQLCGGPRDLDARIDRAKAIERRGQAWLDSALVFCPQDTRDLFERIRAMRAAQAGDLRARIDSHYARHLDRFLRDYKYR